MEPIVECYQAYRQAETDMADAQELMSDPEMKELCQETYAQAKATKEALYEKLQILLLPKDPNDEKNVIVEIRGGVGGEESALFAHSLFRMYSMYAAKMGWSVELLNYNETEIFIETPFRNNAIIDDIVKNCHLNTMLCVASNITMPDEKIVSKSIADWKSIKYDWNKKPAVFLIYCGKYRKKY